MNSAVTQMETNSVGFVFRKKIESALAQEIMNGVSHGTSNHISGYFSVIKRSTEITESGI